MIYSNDPKELERQLEQVKIQSMEDWLKTKEAQNENYK